MLAGEVQVAGPPRGIDPIPVVDSGPGRGGAEDVVADGRVAEGVADVGTHVEHLYSSNRLRICIYIYVHSCIYT